MRTRHNHTRPTPAPPGANGPAATPKPAVADEHHAARSASAEDIRLRAYQKWERAGKPAGDGVRFWLEAEQELIHGT